MSTSARWIVTPSPPLARLPWRGGWLAMPDRGREAHYFGAAADVSLCGTATRGPEHGVAHGQRCAVCIALLAAPESAA